MTEPTDWTRCLIGGGSHAAQDGMRICARHAQRLSEDLRDVELEYSTLDPRKSLTARLGAGKGGSLASHQTPVDVDVLVLTDRRRNSGRITADDHDPHGLDDTPETLDVLGSWARLVREERGLATPTGPATISGERDLLTRQLPWIIEQDWVDDMAQEVHQLLGALQRANRTQRVPAGRDDSITNGAECGGTIWHVTIDHHDGGQPEPGFRCDKCRRVWTGTGALRLRDQLGHVGQVSA